LPLPRPTRRLEYLSRQLYERSQTWFRTSARPKWSSLRGGLERTHLDAVSDFFTDDRIVAGIRRGCFAYFDAFPDLHIALDELIAEGDRVFVRSTMTGTHDGEYKGIPATGRHISAESAEVFRIADGMFVGYWCMTNVAGLMRQLMEEPVGAQA
jgi:predicted ester cyclase